MFIIPYKLFLYINNQYLRDLLYNRFWINVLPEQQTSVFCRHQDLSFLYTQKSCFKIIWKENHNFQHFFPQLPSSPLAREKL